MKLLVCHTTLPQAAAAAADTRVCEALQEQMSRLNDTALIGGERVDATDHCLAGIARLSSEVKDASSYLPPHDQRTYSEVCLDDLGHEMEEN